MKQRTAEERKDLHLDDRPPNWSNELNLKKNNNIIDNKIRKPL